MNAYMSKIKVALLLLHFDFSTNNVIATNHQESDDIVTVSSSCNDIELDGMYYIKPTEYGPVIPVICSGGYSMIDASLDYNMLLLPQYLSTYDWARTTKDYILSNWDDTATFRQWWLPSNENTKYRVAKDCETCEPGEFGDNTTYYTSSHLYCISSLRDSGCTDDPDSKDYYEYACHQCDSGSFVVGEEVDPTDWTSCTATHMDADTAIDMNHDECVNHGLTFHPVLSLIRDACPCYQPSEETQYYEVNKMDLPLVTMDTDTVDNILDTNDAFVIDDSIQFDTSYDDPEVPIDERATNTIYLYQNDFVDGTYKIRSSGNYVIMEDIVFNFNAPKQDDIDQDTFSANSIDNDELYWYPTREQSADSDQYPGLYEYNGAYTLGFFAGITIECSYVTIDLNGYTLSQHYQYYFQQRFFSIIELASQQFHPGTGPAYWGAQLTSSSHIIIKNGNLGLSSHQGIHGVSNQYVLIQNVNIFDFDVAGIQCNGCSHMMVTDLQIGPQNDQVPVLGRYTHGRAILPRLQQFMLEYGDNEIQFVNRDQVTVEYLIDRLINQMDMMYDHFVKGVQYDDDDEEWIASKKLFYNDLHWMDGCTAYGLEFSGTGAAVAGIGARLGDTQNITVKNVEIFGIYSALIEKIKFEEDGGATRLIFFDPIDWVATSDQVDDVTKSKYIGDAYTDVVFAVGQFVGSLYFQYALYLTDTMTEYVFNGEIGLSGIFRQSSKDDPDTYVAGGVCGTDIQQHSSKGTIGLRIDGTQDFVIDNVYIHDIYNWADLGSETWCGQYPGVDIILEDIDIQYGYCGTRSHAMIMDWATGTVNNLKIRNVESYNGEANGITVYKGCDVTFSGIDIDDVNAGTQLSQDVVDELQLPNLVPRACGIDIRADTVVNIDDINGVQNGDSIYGFETCDDDDDGDSDGDSNDDDDKLVSIPRLTFVLGISLSIFAFIFIKMYFVDASTNQIILLNKNNEYTPLLTA